MDIKIAKIKISILKELITECTVYDYKASFEIKKIKKLI